MCWNETISLNTFIFSVAVLGFIYYNNTYTQYKLDEFKSPFMYLFFLSIVGMQLVEYFLWRAIKENDTKTNNRMSIVGSLLAMSQPITISLLMTDKFWQPILTWAYVIFIIPFIGMKYIGNTDKFMTTVDKKTGNLEWKWFLDFKFEKIQYFMYWLLVIPSLFYLPKVISWSIVIALIVTSVKYGFIDNTRMTWGSKWCWVLNGLMLYYLIKLMVVIPFKDMKTNLFCK